MIDLLQTYRHDLRTISKAHIPLYLSLRDKDKLPLACKLLLSRNMAHVDSIELNCFTARDALRYLIIRPNQSNIVQKNALLMNEMFHATTIMTFSPLFIFEVMKRNNIPIV